MEYKRAQSSIEFVILVGFIMTAFTIFFLIINENLREKTENRMNMEIKEIALNVQNEINLAHQSMEGYFRRFDIPSTVLGKDYNISINQGLIFVNSLDGKFSASFSTNDVVGQLIKSENTIRKQNGLILLNN